MDATTRFVLFTLDRMRLALGLAAVERVVRMVEITPVPLAPPVISGIINVHGEVIPVVDLRLRLNLPSREVELTDQLIIAHTPRRRVAIIADALGGVIERAETEQAAGIKNLPDLEQVSGVLSLPDGLVLIQDLEDLLSLDDERRLDVAIKQLLDGRPNS